MQVCMHAIRRFSILSLSDHVVFLTISRCPLPLIAAINRTEQIDGSKQEDVHK